MLNRQSILTFVLVFAAGFLGWLILRDLPQKIEIQKQVGDLKNKIEVLKKDLDREKSLAEYFKTGGYLEKQARIRLNLKKEGEEVVFVYRKEEPEEGSAENKTENPFLSKLKEWFKIFLSRD